MRVDSALRFPQRRAPVIRARGKSRDLDVFTPDFAADQRDFKQLREFRACRVLTARHMQLISTIVESVRRAVK